MVRAHAPGAPPRRQGAELPQAGARLVVPRSVRRARRHPDRPRHHVPPERGLPLSLLPRPHDLRRGRAQRRGDPPERHVEGDDVASGGRHMSNHFAKPAIHVQNVSSCVSNHALHATGLGRAIRTYGSEAVVFCSLGESSTSEGYFYEAVNGASREKLPVVFVVQDNGYGISVPKSDQTANLFASDNFAGLPERQDRPLRREGPLRLGPRDARGRRVREVRRGLRDRPRRVRPDPAPTRTPTGTSSTARPRSSPPRRRSTRSRASAGCSSRAAPSPRRRSPRSRPRTSASTTRRPTAAARRRIRTRPRSSTSSSPSRGRPRATASRASP